MEDNIKVLERVKAKRTFHQLGILVLDGSGSMTAVHQGGLTLGQMVNVAVQNFIQWFSKHGSIKQNISLAVIKFDDNAVVECPPTPLTEMEGSRDWDPTIGMEGGTDLGKALELAAILANQHLATETKVPASAVIAVLSDGMTLDPDRAKSVADRTKSNPEIKIACSYFLNPHPEVAKEAASAEQILREVASPVHSGGPKIFTNSSNIDDLRKFFIASQTNARL